MQWVDETLIGKPESALAIVDHDGARVRYGDLQSSTQALARFMQDAGVRAGDRVMVVAENCAQVAVCLFAAARLRAWAVPVNARVTAAELGFIRDHAAPRLTLFTVAASPDARRHAESLGVQSDAGGEVTVLGASMLYLADQDVSAEIPGQDPDDTVAALVYTSGTTGTPKGVMLSHACLLFNAHHAAMARKLVPEDVITLALPLTHIMALTTSFLAAVHAGAAVRLLPRFSVATQLAALAAGDSIMTGVPQVYRQILDALESGEGDLVAPNLRQIGCGGAPLDPALKARIEARFGLPLTNGYGMTEAGPGISSTNYGPYRSDGSVGYVYPDCAVRLSKGDGESVGELEFQGPNVMLGYYKNPAATAEAITSDGWLRTGDLARIDSDGSIHLVGRKRELIIRSGFNVYPPEVEAALLSCPGVRQAAVVGRAVSDNEEVIAFLTCDGTANVDAIRNKIGTDLAPYKRPHHYVIVDSMPMTSSGKIRKPELLALFGATLPEQTDD